MKYQFFLRDDGMVRCIATDKGVRVTMVITPAIAARYTAQLREVLG